MDSGKLYSAEYPLRSHYHPYLKIHTQVKVVLSIASLCFFILFLASCGQSPEAQSSTNGSPKQVNQVSNSQINYVAIGASDSFGIGTSDPYTQNWPTDLADKLGQNVHLINLSIPGITLHDALNVELPVALDSHPELVTIWLGVNDIVDHVQINSYSHDLDFMLKRLRSQSPSARILIANIPDLTLLPYFALYNQQLLHQQIDQYNATIVYETQQYHALLVNLSQQNYDPVSYTHLTLPTIYSV